MKNKSELDLRLVLPNHLVIPSSGTHLYRYGISWFRFININRHFIHNPYFIFSVVFIYIIRCIIAIKLTSSDDRIYIIIGDWGYFIGTKYHINILLIICGYYVISSQFVHFYDYITGVKPLYLSAFEMMSGLVSPISVGLNSHNDVKKLLKISKYLLIYLPKSIITSTLTGFFVSLILFKSHNCFNNI